MLSKDYSAEFKRRFADRYADGATITHAATRVRPYEVNREALEEEDRPRRRRGYRQAEEEQPLPQEFKLRVVGAYLRGEGDYRDLALEHGVRN